MCLLGVIIVRFNKAIIAEKWQTFISFRSSASRYLWGHFKEYDLIKSLASGGFILIRPERVVLFKLFCLYNQSLSVIPHQIIK